MQEIGTLQTWSIIDSGIMVHKAVLPEKKSMKWFIKYKGMFDMKESEFT